MQRYANTTVPYKGTQLSELSRFLNRGAGKGIGNPRKNGMEISEKSKRRCIYFVLYPHNLRKTTFTIPRFNTVSYGKHSLRYLEPKIWNTLADNLRILPFIQTFKRQISNTKVNLFTSIDFRNQEGESVSRQTIGRVLATCGVTS